MSLPLFSERLKNLLEIEGVSRRALSFKANVQQKSILNWLAAKNYPRYDSLVKLAEFFNVGTDYLLGLDETEDRILPEERCSIEEIPPQFREKLISYLNGAGITKYALAKKLGVGQTTLERWFHGAMPDIAVLIKLAAVMGETVDYLLGRE